MRTSDFVRQTGRRGLALFAAGLGGWLAGFTPSSADAYDLAGHSWPADQTIVMDLQLGAPDHALIDGSTTYNQVAAAALAVWNPYLGSGVQFAASYANEAPAPKDHRNSVFFSETLYGEDLGPDTLGITGTNFDKNHVDNEDDVVFNAKKPFDSYRGPLRKVNGRYLYDLRRTAIHEFGHVLGLGHVPQGSRSIMTYTVTDLDTVQADDVAGVQAIYGISNVAPLISSVLTGGGARGASFSYQITAIENPTSYQASGLPTGLNIDTATGLISGAATDVGTSRVAISATNAYGTGTSGLKLTFADVPVITSPLTIRVLKGEQFRYQLTASNSPTVFRAGGPLDGSLTFDSADGVLWGIPSSYLDEGSYFVSAGNIAGVAEAELIVQIVNDYGAVPVCPIQNPSADSLVGAFIGAADGNLYGLSDHPSNHLIQITPDGKLTTLYQLTYKDGGTPGRLIQGTDGAFYGTTNLLPDSQRTVASIFKFTTASGFTTVHSFAYSEGAPASRLAFGGDGELYAVLGDGFYQAESIYRTTFHTPPARDYTVPVVAVGAGNGPGGAQGAELSSTIRTVAVRWFPTT